MGKSIYIAEKPSVAREFAKALKLNAKNRDGYMESENAIVTWCVGHLVTMSYPEEYDPALKKWSLDTLPFIPDDFKYEVIPQVAKQFQIVSGLLTREDVDRIYVCTDSGREGEYIYRLVEQEAHVKGKERRRVWIDSQTEEEILRGIREAKDLSEYDNLAASAYLRAKEDYLMGINFSRLLTLKYGNSISNYLHTKYSVISVGRVMTCVLGMVVRREREIRDFVKTPFYRVVSTIDAQGHQFEGEWKAVKGSRYFESYDLYKENGFKEREKAEELIRFLLEGVDQKEGPVCRIESIEKKKEKKKLTLDEYIEIGKGDIIVYVIVTIILLAISLYVGIKYNFYFHIIFIGILMIGRIVERIDTLLTLKKIKSYLVENNLLDKIGNIDYWNDRYYFLTDNYMIIKQNKIIDAFKYSEIERIYKESYVELSKHSYSQEHLHIVVNNNDFKILISTTVLVGEDFRDISDYLIEKNPKIIVDETVNNKKIDIFRIGKR